MQFHFNSKKTTQAVTKLLGFENGKMPYLKLMKLMYLADREALLRWHRPITGDAYVSMKMGPVLSALYDLIKGRSDAYWQEHVGPRKTHDVELLKAAPTDELSEAEEDLLLEIYGRFGKLDKFKLVELSHELPEWKDPGRSMFPIEIEEILRIGGKSPEEIEAIRLNVAEAESMKQFLSA